jgi:hypothetical protein
MSWLGTDTKMWPGYKRVWSIKHVVPHFLLGEVNTFFLIQFTCRLLASIITGQFLNKLFNIVTFLFLANHMTYLLFFIKILY